MLKLDWPRFISPTWRYSIATEGVVVDEVTVVANGDKLTLQVCINLSARQ